jgi:hypothetical protein
MLELATIFSIDIAAYAIMNNHYHVVLHIDQEKAAKWSVREVCNRWHKLFSGNDLSCRYLKHEELNTSEQKILAERVELWRARLIDLSWFMRCRYDKIIRNDFEQLCWP